MKEEEIDMMDQSKHAQERLPGTEEEWRRQLTPEQFEVLRNKGTERAFTGAYASEKEPGVYRCAGCGAELFSSDTKFESGTGWPSFWKPIDPGAVALHEDYDLGMRRTEVTCARCGGHLGHVFPDGPQPTGDRYCMNSIALDLDAKPGSADAS
jgi:peptide-methionine (R)-S-oxide reductase